MGHLSMAMITRGYPFHIPWPVICFLARYNWFISPCLLKKTMLRVPNRMHLCQNFGEKNGSNPSSYSYYIITIADICIYIYIYLHIDIGHTIYMYIYGCPTCCFPLVNPLRHPLTHVLRIGMEKPSMDSTICWCRRTPSPSPPSTGTSRSRRRPLPQPHTKKSPGWWVNFLGIIFVKFLVIVTSRWQKPTSRMG